MSKFEQLPDEILLEICVFLRPFDVINSFGQLNSRLQRTISQYRRDVDLHHLTLKQFQRWFDYLLSPTTESVVNLVISNWNSPGQIYLFNQLTNHVATLSQLFPNLKQLRLIDFSNNDIDILSKFQGIERIFIDADALIPCAPTTHARFDQYLFCSNNQFKEIRLWGIEDGLHLQHQIDIHPNLSLERLTISVTLLDDLILLFRRAPNLKNLNIEITQNVRTVLRPDVLAQILPESLTFFHFQTTDRQVLSFEDLAKIVSHMPSIEFLSLDLDTNDMKYADGQLWNETLTTSPQLKQIFFKIRISINSNPLFSDIGTILQSFEQTEIPICAYTDTKALHLDTVPYDMTPFDTNMSVTISPNARLAKTTHMDFFQQRARRVQTLIIDGQHAATSIKDYLSVLNRFPAIEILQINAINISDDENKKIDFANADFHLPNLGYLHYIRSTSCKVHLPFFMSLVHNPTVTPQLKALSIMYGDLIYLCKRLQGGSLARIKELWIYAGDADGHVIEKDIHLLLQTFPSLYHFFFNNQSDRLINRRLRAIVEMILQSLPKLISFRISCNKGSFDLSSSMDEQTCHVWLKRICSLPDDAHIHVTIDKKILAVWK